MAELRLTDPDGYTVPGTAQTVPVAPQWRDFGYDADAYRVLPAPAA